MTEDTPQESPFFKRRRWQPPPGEDSTVESEIHTPPRLLIFLGDEPEQPPRWLADETLPEEGVGILGGQFGAAKTFVAADLAAGVLLGSGEFSGKAILCKGAVLWLAAEGQSEIDRRMRAALVARGADGDATYAFARQAGDVPILTEKDALEWLKALAIEAMARFGCALALIVIDTLSAAACFDDENSAADTQKVMNVLAAFAHWAHALVVVLDHYGKVADTGIRGSSAKSAAADAILACLSEVDQTSGAVASRRLAVTKLRSGPTGRVAPFRTQTNRRRGHMHGRVGGRRGEVRRARQGATEHRAQSLQTRIPRGARRIRSNDSSPYRNVGS